MNTTQFKHEHGKSLPINLNDPKTKEIIIRTLNLHDSADEYLRVGSMYRTRVIR